MRIVEEVFAGHELKRFADEAGVDFEYGDYDNVFSVLKDIEKETEVEFTLQYASDLEKIKRLVTEVSVIRLAEMFGEDEEYWEQMLDEFGGLIASHRSDMYTISRDEFRRMIFIHLKNNYPDIL